MACIDLKKPNLILSQFSDTSTYSKVRAKLQIYHPTEVRNQILTVVVTMLRTQTFHLPKANQDEFFLL